MKELRSRLQPLLAFGAGVAVAAVMGVAGLEGLHFSGSSAFCVSCHEMRVVGEQGFDKSVHAQNVRGVVAKCSGCHVPPETDLFAMLWVKSRDGGKDVYAHFLGQADPLKMDWDALGRSARAKIHDASCQECHGQLQARGLPIKAILAHREYLRYRNTAAPKRCLECHRQEFHGAFKSYLLKDKLAAKGEDR